MSRTAKTATITIVDNRVRAISCLIKVIKELRDTDRQSLHQIVDNFDNDENITEALKIIQTTKLSVE